MQSHERADDDLVGIERGVEPLAAVQLRLRRVLRDLPPYPALGAHLPGIERVDRARIGAERSIGAAERGDALPPVALRAARAEADPSELQGREAITGIGHQLVDG